MKFKLHEKIKELKEEGYEVRIRHARLRGKQHELKPKGGLTYVYITDKENKTLGIGKSVCSREDNFNRKLGATIALGRAIDNWKGKDATKAN